MRHPKGALGGFASLLFVAGLAAPAEAATPIFVELEEPQPTVVARHEAARKGAAFDEELHRASVRLAQDEFLTRLAGAGIAYTLSESVLATAAGAVAVPDRYTELVNAVRLEVDGWDVGAVRRMPEVRHISVDEPMALHLDKSVPYIRASGPASARSLGIRGEGEVNTDGSSTGQVVAILDTGIDHTNPMFDTTTPEGDRDWTDPGDTRPVRLQGSPYVPGVNHPKVGYRFLFQQAPFEGDDTGHGTNTASTAAGLKATADPVLNNGEIVEGVAPDAILMDYKVCPSLVCLIPQALLALEDCALPVDVAGFPKPRCTVVSMSFGSDAGDPNSAHGTAAGNLQFAGVLSVASAGNAGPSENTIGSPSASRRVVSVAATVDPGVAPNSVEVLEPDGGVRDNPGPAPSPETLAATGQSFLAFFAPESNGGLGFDQAVAQYYVDIGLGDTPEQVPTSVNGRVCLAARGSTADLGATGSGLFGNKAAQCAGKGGIALLVYNNAPGQIGVVLAPSGIPVFTMSREDGLILRDTLGFESGEFGAVSNFPVRLNPADPSLFVPDTAGFSSRGPNNDFLVLKPDITAPGTSILMGASKIGVLGSPTNFTVASGTSFSCPHVSGSAALVRDVAARSDFAPSMVRAALMNSSTRLREADGDTEIAEDDPNNFIHETGSGLAHVLDAIQVQALMGTNQSNGSGGPDDATHPDFLPSHSFGELPLIGNGLPATEVCQQRTITVTVTDVGGGAGSYDLSVVDGGALRGNITRPLTEPGFSLALGSSSVAVPAAGSATFDVTIAVDGTPSGLQIAGADVNGQQATEFLWHVLATRSDGSEVLRMPFFARFREGSQRVCPGDGPADKITGGGWISEEGGNGKANFGFNAHGDKDPIKGNLNYKFTSAGAETHLKGSVTEVQLSSDSEASFSGPCQLDGSTPCSYSAFVEDNAEPGKGADRFSIQVFVGGAPFHSADDLLAGGNIQIHR